MIEEISQIDELPAAKRRKRWAEAQVQMEMPAPLSWPGLIIPQAIQIKFLNLIDEGGKKVIEATLENTVKNRKDHE